MLNIGDDIKYHDTAGKNGTEKYTKGWKVLGAENGELLIMSADDVEVSEYFNSDLDLEEGKKYIQILQVN